MVNVYDKNMNKYQRYRLRDVYCSEPDALGDYKFRAEQEGLEFTGVDEHWKQWGFIPCANIYFEVYGTEKEIKKFEDYCEKNFTDSWKIRQYRTER